MLKIMKMLLALRIVVRLSQNSFSNSVPSMAHLRAPMRALSPAHDRRTFNDGARMRDVSKIHHELSKFVAVC